MKEIEKHNDFLTDAWHSGIFTMHSTKYHDIKIKTVTDIAGFSKLNGLWNDVVLSSSAATVYQTFEWLYNWWNCFSSSHRNSLHILTIYSSGKLIGIGPFFIQDYSFGSIRIYRRLKLIGGPLNTCDSHSNPIEEHGLSDYLDIICYNGYEEKVAGTMSFYFKDLRYIFDELDFQNISENSFVFKWLLPSLTKRNFRINITKTDVCPRLNVPCSMDDYLSSVKAGTRRKFRQAQNHTMSNSLIRIENVDDKNFLPYMKDLKNLHQNRWNEIGYPGLFSDKRFEDFMLIINKIFLNKDQLWFKVVKYNDKIIAARLGFKFKNRVYDYLSGFDNRQFAASLRPGFMLVFTMIKDAISNNLDAVDFLRGPENYKLEISSAVCYNHSAVINHSGSASGLRKIMFVFVKSQIKLLHKIKSESAIIKLHKAHYGKKIFLLRYIWFCLKRIKSFRIKSKFNENMEKMIRGSINVGNKTRKDYSKMENFSFSKN